jgi:DNA-binding NtrC family response regulator
MKKIMLCSSNPILIKSLYCVLREEGFNVEIVEHPSLAVHKVLFRTYDFIVIDSEPFGLSAEDAVQIIKTVSPGTPTIVVGGGAGADVPSVETPVDLEEFKHTIHSIAV